MATYIVLAKYTHQGITNIKQSPDRLDTAKQAIQSLGGEIKAFYLTMGQYDAVAIVEAPDDETAAKLSLVNAAIGRVRIQTLRAFTEQETIDIASQLPV